MKIDVFSHFCPPRYKEALGKSKNAGKIAYELNLIDSCASLYDMDKRRRILDKYECCQVLTLVSPPIEEVCDKLEAVELAKIANDEIAETITKYPEYFLGGIASLPLNDFEASMEELDRVINQLKFKGVLIHSATMGRPIDLPVFLPLYEKMVEHNLPVFIHPWRTIHQPDYKDEDESLYKIWSTYGWPYETSAAITRLIFKGVFEKFPSLKVITHHAGGMIPFFAERIRSGFDLWETRTPLNPKRGLTRPTMDYYKGIYADTAIAGHTPGLMCAYEFFGPEHLLFGTDMPMDSQMGYRLVRDIIEAIENMDIPSKHKKMIYEDNVKSLLRLPV
jgi:aminocarboxymuconate-semialdehyde decarboxylase